MNPDMMSARHFMATAPAVTYPPLRCWRCGTTGTTDAFDMIRPFGYPIAVCKSGADCVPTVVSGVPLRP